MHEFNEFTFFSFKLEKPSKVTLMVLDLFGKNVATLISDENMSAGKHVITFSPEKYNLSSGIYSYTLLSDKQTITRKMIYAR